VSQSLDAKPSPKPLKSFPSKGFGEPISNLFCGGDILEFDCSVVLDLSLPLALDLHMFCAGVVLWVRGERNGSLVIPADDRGVCSLVHIQFVEKPSQPDCFFGGLCLP
jgi:hypothetical protein